MHGVEERKKQGRGTGEGDAAFTENRLYTLPTDLA